jgi:tRNA threonylcarbamoyladenosine biosynthesis protein TsaB
MTLLLAVDTSGTNGSMALARTPAGPRESGIRLLEIAPLSGGAFSAQLVPQIASLLEKCGFDKRELTAFAVASGPGSFTGLRVGLAAIKALAEALRKPIVAVSLLEAAACSAASHGRVLATLDAGRGDLYVGDYEVHREFHRDVPKCCQMSSERLLSKEEFLAEANRSDVKGKVVVTSDTGLAAIARSAGIRVELIERPDSAMIARLGWEHLQRGETVPPEDLEANYIRHPDAEIFSKPAP